MGRSRTALSRPAATVIATLALVLLLSAATGSDAPAYARVVMLATSAFGAVGALVLWRDDTVAAWVVNLLLALVSAGGAAAVGLIGLPGGICAGFGACSVAVIGLSLVFVVLLALDARRRPAPDEGRPPYAL